MQEHAVALNKLVELGGYGYGTIHPPENARGEGS